MNPQNTYKSLKIYSLKIIITFHGEKNLTTITRIVVMLFVTGLILAIEV